MKRKIGILLLIMLCTISATGCKNKYEGYWCRYEETATILVLLERNHTEENRTKIDETITIFEDIESYNFSRREDYANELGEDIEGLDIYDTYLLTFNSVDHIDSYVETLEKEEGVREVKKINAKTNVELYHIDKNGKYTFTDSDLATEENLIKGKYKIKKGVITFTPEEESNKTTFLYIKDGYLCRDADCKGIFAESNSTCSSKKTTE